MTSPVVLILGSGANVGQHVARSFAAKGYKVALTSRNPKPDDGNKDQITIAGDLADPSSVPTVFEKLKQQLGLPSVVVYNGQFHRVMSIHDGINHGYEIHY